MKIAIFGARGYIGARLARALNLAGADLVSVSSNEWFDESGVLSDRLAVDRAVRSVVYLSQSPHYRELPARAAHVWSVNVVSAVKAADWARRCGATRFVYASSGSVYPPSFVPHAEDEPVRRDEWYALSKVHAEDALALATRDLDVTCARLFCVYGPSQPAKIVPTLIESVRERRPIRLEPHPTDSADRGGLRLSLTYVDDAVRVLARLAMGSGPRLLNVAGTEVQSIRAMAEAAGARLDREPIFEPSATARRGDVIADTTRLLSMYGDASTGFDAGLDAMLTARVQTIHDE